MSVPENAGHSLKSTIHSSTLTKMTFTPFLWREWKGEAII